MVFTLSPLGKTFLVFSAFLFLFATTLTIWRLVEFFDDTSTEAADIVLGFVLLVNLGREKVPRFCHLTKLSFFESFDLFSRLLACSVLPVLRH